MRRTSSYQLMHRLEQLEDEKLTKMREETDEKASLEMLQNQMLQLSLQGDKKAVPAEAESMKD